jgi:hypothetical protein
LLVDVTCTFPDSGAPAEANGFRLSDNIYGNPHQEKGVDETYSEGMERFEQQSHREEQPDVGLKDPPEEIYPSLMC